MADRQYRWQTGKRVTGAHLLYALTKTLSRNASCTWTRTLTSQCRRQLVLANCPLLDLVSGWSDGLNSQEEEEEFITSRKVINQS